MRFVTWMAVGAGIAALLFDVRADAALQESRDRFGVETSDTLDCRRAIQDETDRWNFEHRMYLQQIETLRQELNQKLDACPQPDRDRCRERAYGDFNRGRREIERADDEGYAGYKANLRAIEAKCATNGSPPGGYSSPGPGKDPGTPNHRSRPDPSSPGPSSPPPRHTGSSPRPSAGTPRKPSVPGDREPCPTGVNPSVPCSASGLSSATIHTQSELVRLVWQRYNTGRPVGIFRVASDEPSCLMVLSGTEPTNIGQATTLPEDVTAAVGLDDAFRRAVFAGLRTPAVRDLCPSGTRWIIAGHSLGGMEGQHVALDEEFARLGYHASHVITFGSPGVTREAPGVTYRRFSSIGDPIPEITRTLNVYRPAHQLYVDDRCAPERGRAIIEERERLQSQLAPMTNPFEPPVLAIARQLAAIFPGALEAHMAYPCIHELDRYDALGVMGGESSLQLDFRNAQYLAAPRPFLDAPAY